MATFLVFDHLAMMNRALFGILAVIVLRLIAMFHQIRESHACFFEQIFAGVTTQGDPADEAILGDIACVPQAGASVQMVSGLLVVVGLVLPLVLYSFDILLLFRIKKSQPEIRVGSGIAIFHSDGIQHSYEVKQIDPACFPA